MNEIQKEVYEVYQGFYEKIASGYQIKTDARIIAAQLTVAYYSAYTLPKPDLSNVTPIKPINPIGGAYNG